MTSLLDIGVEERLAEEREYGKVWVGVHVTRQSNCGLFLAHIIEPSDEEGQEYDIFIYLIRHKSQYFDDIEKAEFFLGKYWDNKVFTETPKDGLIGIATSAYGPLLCTCRVTMKDGTVVRLSRYIDFEMGRVFEGRS